MFLIYKCTETQSQCSFQQKHTHTHTFADLHKKCTENQVVYYK